MLKFQTKPVPRNVGWITTYKSVGILFESRDYFISQDEDTNRFVVNHKQSGSLVVSFDSFLLAKEALRILARITKDDPIVYQPTTKNPKTLKQVKLLIKQLRGNSLFYHFTIGLNS